MNSSPPGRPSDVAANSSPGSSFVRLLGIFVLTLVVLLFLGGLIGLEIPARLGFGWIQFLSRVLPKISWNWDLIGMAALCLAGLLGVGHGFIKWLTGHISTARGTPWSWPWRWTWCGAASLGLLFLVGMAVGGIFHQAAWIAASPEPLYEGKTRVRDILEIKEFHVALRMALDDSKDNCELARRELRKSQNEYLPARPGQAAPGERVTCLLIVDRDGKCFGAVLFPRLKPQPSGPNDLFYWYQNKESWRPMSELGSLLRMHRGQLVAL
jgi:hypothetical protein